MPKIAPVAIFTLESTEKFNINDANACFIVLRSVLNDLGMTTRFQLYFLSYLCGRDIYASRDAIEKAWKSSGRLD